MFSQRPTIEVDSLAAAILPLTSRSRPACWLVLRWVLLTTVFPLALIYPCTVASSAEPVDSTKFSDADVEFFERKVRPLFVAHCYECHSAQAETLEGGLRLDARATILAGGDTEPAIVPGHPDQSLLIDALEYGDLYEMPPKSKLPEETIDVFREWVRRGAPWPQEKLQGRTVVVKAFDWKQRKAEHWAWRPLSDPPLPEVRDKTWALKPLDRFVLAKLEDRGLQPASAAEPHALVRRAYFDLIGLPPPPEIVIAFDSDPSPEAFAALVDRLLASPQFGERWCRHWLDLMRYAESRGHEHDYDLPNAWQYRDYVTRAINADVPYDQFVMEHIAGDLLDPPRWNPVTHFNESILGTGFWYLGDWVHSPVDIRKDETDRIDNAIDVFGKAFLGLTIACARCHDHKFDAISQSDYYALAGFMQSSGYRQVRFETLDHNRQIAQQHDDLRRQYGRELAKLVAADRVASSQQVEALLLAATEAAVAGLAPHASAAATVHSKVSAFVAADRLSAENGPQQLAEIATRRGVSVGALSSWLNELLVAAGDKQHPLHGLGLAATNADSLAASSLALPICESNGGSSTLPDSSKLVIDFDVAQSAWFADGPAFGSGPLQRGEVVPADEGTTPIIEIVDRGRAQLFPELAKVELADGAMPDTGLVSKWPNRPGRLLRTPTVELQGGKLYYLVRGAANIQAVVDSHRLVQGPLHNETLKTVDFDSELRWVEHDLTPYIGHGVQVEFSPNGDHPLQIFMVVEGKQAPPLPTINDASNVAVALLSNDGSNDVAQLARDYAALIIESLHRLAENKLATSGVHRALATWAVQRRELWPAAHDLEGGSKRADAIQQKLADYQQRLSDVLKMLRKQSATAPAMWDGSPENQPLLIRGNSHTPGPLVERRLLTAIAGENQPAIQAGSGRLELAHRLFAPDNPLPSRVMANRIWHHLTGRGIVPSVDNIGVLGQVPTHPELLDFLASRLIDSGWSVKALIRTIMLSRTYQMSSRRTAAGELTDPENNLLHRMPVRRLQGETIRDTMLALAEQLDPKLGGPSVPVHLTQFMQGRGRPEQSGPLDGNGRRSLYISVRRNFLSPMMLTFDVPQPAGPVGRRLVSNVPAQALILMNDPFVVQQARRFAEHLLDVEADEDRRIKRMYREALARLPDEQEAAAARQFLAKQAIQYENIDSGSPTQEATAQIAAWADLCHVMFNVKEFIYLN